MMEVSIKRNTTTPTGYELVDNGVSTPIVKSVVEKKTGITWLVLPKNSTGRTLANAHKVAQADGDYELKPKTERTKSTDKVSTPKVNRLNDDAKTYLSDDEYEMFTKLINKIEFNRQVKVLNDQIAQLEAKKAEMMKGGN